MFYWTWAPVKIWRGDNPCPMPLGFSGISAFSSSSDISEGWNDGVCRIHVLLMGLYLSLTVGWVSSSSLTIDAYWMRRSSLYQVCNAADAYNWWYWLYPGTSLKVDTLSLGTSGTVLVNSCLYTFHERMVSSATVYSLLCWFHWYWTQCCVMTSLHLHYGT